MAEEKRKRGAPIGSKNAEKEGAQSKITADTMTPAEKRFAKSVKTDGREAMEDELRLLKVRERRIMQAIAKYDAMPDDAIALANQTNTNSENYGKTTTKYSDSAASRSMKLNTILNIVQGRIDKAIKALRSMDDADRRHKLEERKLELMNMRITGQVEYNDPEEGGIKADDMDGLDSSFDSLESSIE